MLELLFVVRVFVKGCVYEVYIPFPRRKFLVLC
jgi:hypothetical protein